MRINREAINNKQSKEQAVIDVKHDTLVKDIIKKYEIQIGRMKNELNGVS
jgi:hypothetical protein